MKVTEQPNPESAQSRLAYTLAEAAPMCGVSYVTLYRAACRGDLRVLSGFGRMMVSAAELERFLGKSKEYQPRARKVDQ